MLQANIYHCSPDSQSSIESECVVNMSAFQWWHITYMYTCSMLVLYTSRLSNLSILLNWRDVSWLAENEKPTNVLNSISAWPPVSVFFYKTPQFHLGSRVRAGKMFKHWAHGDAHMPAHTRTHPPTSYKKTRAKGTSRTHLLGTDYCSVQRVRITCGQIYFITPEVSRSFDWNCHPLAQ